MQTQIRVPVELYDQLVAAANERGVSINWLATRAIEDFLRRLIPANELKLTRP